MLVLWWMVSISGYVLIE